MKKIDLIMFDLDGTLVDSSDNIVNSVNFTLQDLGVSPKSKEEIISYVGTGSIDLIRKSLGEGSGVSLAEALPAFKDRYRQCANSNSRLYPNVKTTLEYFKDKFKVIITNGNQDIAAGVVSRLGIGDYFVDIIGAHEEKECVKPSACGAQEIMNKLGIDKEKAIIVGDMDVDILTGKNAGVITCAVTYGIGKKEDIVKSQPDFIIDDIRDLAKIIN